MTHIIESKGTYVVGDVDSDGNKVTTTEKGFTFTQERGEELGFDFYDVEGAGTALLFGNQVFFLQYWTDEHLDRASTVFNQAIEKEKERRNETS